MLCAWVDHQGVSDIRSLADLKSFVGGWDGREPPPTVWNTTRASLKDLATAAVEDMRQRALAIDLEMRRQQLEAARLRLIEELGRMLICTQPETDNLNGRLHALASQSNPTATRLRRVMNRIGGYPDWELRHIVALRAFREELTGFQRQVRLTGRELEAALDDPRWAFGAAG